MLAHLCLVRACLPTVARGLRCSQSNLTSVRSSFLSPLRQSASPPVPTEWLRTCLQHSCMGTRSKPRSKPQSSGNRGKDSRISSGAKSASDNEQAKRKSRRLKDVTKGALSEVGSLRPAIQWYPGHIAKAERALKDSLRVVDVVIEVRDCRIPISTAHPSVPSWIGARKHLLAMGRSDLVPQTARSQWARHLREKDDIPVMFVDAKRGRGVSELKKLAVAAGADVNSKRTRKGLLPRPVRCLVIGYPNVGKSALINRLVGKRAAKSANKPGVTRNFQWVRISNDIELLDMPGIIPMKLGDQTTALRLAVCDDIGQAAYDRQITAGLLVDELKEVAQKYEGYVDLQILEHRFKVNPMLVSGEDFIYLAAEKLHKGDLERTAVRLLTEFRAGDLGPVALESPQMLKP